MLGVKLRFESCQLQLWRGYGLTPGAVMGQPEEQSVLSVQVTHALAACWGSEQSSRVLCLVRGGGSSS